MGFKRDVVKTLVLGSVGLTVVYAVYYALFVLVPSAWRLTI